MWSHRAARSNAGFNHVPQPVQTEALTAYTNFHNDTPSLPRSTTKAVFEKDCLRAATSAAQRGWSVELQAKSPAAWRFPVAACERRDDFHADGCQIALAGQESCKFHLESGHHSWCESCLCHAHLSSISWAPKNPRMEPKRLILDLIKCIPLGFLPTHRRAIRLLLPNISLARSRLSRSKNQRCTCAIGLGVGTRGSHLRWPLVWRESAAKYAWRPLIRSGLF